MTDSAIRDALVERRQRLFDAPKQGIVGFTDVPEADELLNDLDGHPHVFVLGCVMDRQIRAEKAWLVPYEVSRRLGTFSMDELTRLSEADVKRLMSTPTALHRFVDIMSALFWSALQRIVHRYDGVASRIWVHEPPSAEIVYRFLEFDGIGPKIANMAANILARDFKIPFGDYTFIDISADVHVRRVFSRLGLCPSEPTVDQVIYKARALWPTFPGILDLPCWEIGRTWCRPTDPQCGECYMRELCPTASRP